MSGSNRRVIVLGALSAMAEATCRMLAEEGAQLALLGRDAERLDTVARDLKTRGAAGVHVFARDLLDTSDTPSALQAAADSMGGANAVLIFYGVLGDQNRAETDLEEARRIIAVNFTSAAAWSLASADLLERSGGDGAVLVGVSSVAGDRGRRSNYVYGAAKGGLSILLQGIAHRFAAKPGGARAVTVKAGFVDTPMTAHLKKGPLWATPQQIAQVVRRAMDRGGPILYAPWIWRWIMLAIRLIPDAVFKRVNI
ncbi:SDR family NAD(P)-dependent oxidoreductase [Terricaulis silvestris]|uniref:Putative oxidoreductase n=1 Tax=Terricaulis silvestris TaxID=2686094 RepID=A0A6I6MPB5_9CAUL|nr:SDR family NAD(P)-dependent oxidoreductase [Terricaulis silvestris]QGZ96549.1 putative oxidoreductase [Terricaulis silvestris]